MLVKINIQLLDNLSKFFHNSIRFLFTSKPYIFLVFCAITIMLTYSLLAAKISLNMSNVMGASDAVSPAPTTVSPTHLVNSIGYNSTDIVNQVNQKRSSLNIKTVTLDSNLTEASKEKLDDLITSNYWDNNAPDGTTPWDILEKIGYKYNDATILLAKGYTSAKAVVDGWFNSTNKSFLMDKKYSKVGVSIKAGTIQGESTVVVVMYLATPKTIYTNTTNTTSKNIDCLGPDGKQIKATQKECDEFNSAWGKSKIQPTTPKAQIPSYIAPQNNGKPLITCVVNYTCTNNSYTYQVDADYCKTIQESASSLCNTFPANNTYATPTPSQEEMQVIVDQYNRDVQRCQENAISQYNIAKQNCTVRFGGASSAGEACMQIANGEYDTNNSNCGSTL